MPGVDRLGLDCLVDAIGAAGEQGIGAVALFPYTAQELKTPDAREAVNPGNLVCRAVRAVKRSEEHRLNSSHYCASRMPSSALNIFFSFSFLSFFSFFFFSFFFFFFFSSSF